ncbi:MAG: FAD-dependent monooxygenase [Paracoccaceae bacterium]|nr:FAD-dependent monooxygenase [Paracoccaceae bacterium]
MVQDQEITVLGAGVAGLTVACLLARRGAKVVVLEQAPVIKEIGAGLQVSPNGARVLHAMGLADKLAETSIRADAIQLFHGESGDRVARLDLGRLRPSDEYRFVHRADLITLLADAARAAGAEIRLNQHVTDVRLSDKNPQIHFTDSDPREVPILIGADGLHSKVRIALNGAVAPFFTHQVAWRATIPAQYGIASEAGVYLGQGKHLVTYPLRGGTLRNVIAVEERRRWAEESWSLTDDPMTLRVAFQDFAPEVRAWLDQIESPNLWGLFRHPVAARWSRNGAAILGDAAHPTLPFLAQGANLAFEDAWVMAECLMALPAPEAFAKYQSLRETRVKKVIDAANANARNFHLSGVSRSVAHLGLRAVSSLAPERLLSRFDWLYGHDVTSFSA